MWEKNSIYEAGTFGTLKPYSKEFIDAFMTKPKDWPTPYEEFPLKNGQNDQEYSKTGDHIKKYNLKFARTPLLVAFEVEPGFWSLNMAANPDIIVCQIDHNDKVFRFSEVEGDDALTARTYAGKIFRDNYVQGYNKKRSQVVKGAATNYTTSTDIVQKDFTNSKFLTKLDISNFFKV